MPMHAGGFQRQGQSAGMVPEHFMGKEVLKMNLQDLQQFMEDQLAQNPALVMEEGSQCPICGCVLIGGFCPACGSESADDISSPESDGDEWDDDGMWSAPGPIEDDFEPLALVANPKSLSEHLIEQINMALSGEERRIAEFLIDCLDEDGYLREPLIDIASRFKVSVPQLESVLQIVQTLEPAGVGARDLRECLLIQLRQFDDDSDEKVLAETLLNDYWDGIEKMKLDRIASHLGVETECVTDALEFIRENLTPHPADGFRDPWEKLAPRRESRRVPDVLVRQSEDGLSAEILDPVTGKAAVDESYSSLYAEMTRKKNGYSENETAHIKECVQSARALIESLEFRKSTLTRIAEELVKCQADFITNGAAHLKPLTRKELAHRLEVHESTVSRATNDKTMLLPSGEVIPFDVFFDSALPVKELVRQLASERPGGKAMSDSEIAEKLKGMGIDIARRTVAKYRSQLGVLSIDYRIA